MSKAINIRYERKIVFRGQRCRDVVALIQTHPLWWREKYQPRRVNSVYYDTMARDYYWWHVNGISQRRKVRVRWYGRGQASNFQLELKIRAGQVSYKKTYLLPALITMPGPGDWLSNQVTAGLPPAIKAVVGGLKAKTMVSYNRSYWEALSGQLRLTLDTNLSWHEGVGGQWSRRRDTNELVVVELKYAPHLEREAKRAGYFFHGLPGRFSKYIWATQAGTYD